MLVVDDFTDVADGLCWLLRRWGHESRVAYDGTHALAVAREFRPDVALRDPGPPRMDGYELGRRLRGLPGLGGVALVAVTGYADPGYERRSRQEGYAGHFVKPADLSALEALLTGLAVEKARRAGES